MLHLGPKHNSLQFSCSNPFIVLRSQCFPQESPLCSVNGEHPRKKSSNEVPSDAKMNLAQRRNVSNLQLE